mmetsp:Transcript_33813/g.88821  ORF Transcript_33813/g.88821 Transcript_33813/m.88821 type:complete len:217 (-) Transcript_33813:83-733(-)
MEGPAHLPVADPRLNGELPTRERWYVANLPRTKCETAVQNSMSGDFLVRRSASSKSEILCINDNETIVNFSIAVKDSGLYEFVGNTFQTLGSVVAYVRQNPLKSQSGAALLLGLPASLSPWYVGAMDRDTCETIVRHGQQGDFLVRRRSKGGYAICVNDCGEIRNFSIKRNGTTFSAANEDRASLEEIVDQMRLRPMKGRGESILSITFSARTDET